MTDSGADKPVADAGNEDIAAQIDSLLASHEAAPADDPVSSEGDVEPLKAGGDPLSDIEAEVDRLVADVPSKPAPAVGEELKAQVDALLATPAVVTPASVRDGGEPVVEGAAPVPTMASSDQAEAVEAPVESASARSEPDPGEAGPEVVAARQERGRLLKRVAAGMLEPAARPLASLPASARSTMGWIGLHTLFLAACLWGYLLFFRPPNRAPAAESRSFNFEQGHVPEVAEPAKAEPAGSGKNASGHAPEKGHAPESKSGGQAGKSASKKSAKATESHGGGH